MTKQLYPGVLVRTKAVAIDTVVILLLMISTAFLFGKLERVPDYYRIIAFVLIFVLYDPLFTSLSGGTIGHKANGIQVRKAENHDKYVPFIMAVLRFLIKSVLGIISLMTLSLNDEGKAIHDYATGSIVMFANQTSLQNSNEQEG